MLCLALLLQFHVLCLDGKWEIWLGAAEKHSPKKAKQFQKGWNFKRSRRLGKDGSFSVIQTSRTISSDYCLIWITIIQVISNLVSFNNHGYHSWIISLPTWRVHSPVDRYVGGEISREAVFDISSFPSLVVLPVLKTTISSNMGMFQILHFRDEH